MQVVCKMNHPLPSAVLCGLHPRLRRKQLPVAAFQQCLHGQCQLYQRAQEAQPMVPEGILHQQESSMT
jgi:hypothetical protein